MLNSYITLTSDQQHEKHLCLITNTNDTCYGAAHRSTFWLLA